MASPSVSVDHMTRRLAATPRVFLGPVAVGALLSDVLADHGHDPLSSDWLDALGVGGGPVARRGTRSGVPSGGARAAAGPGSAPVDPAQHAWRRACAVMAWLLADPLVGPLVPTGALVELLRADLHALTAHVAAESLVDDGDRREELARLLLRAAGVTPAGEGREDAADRLSTLDTVTRQRVIAESRTAEEHTRQVRQAMARRRAEEAAAKAMRE